MISPAQRAEVRRLFFAEHWKLGTITAQLGIHPDAVKAAVGSHTFTNLQHRIGPSVLDPYKLFIRDTLERYPRLRSTRIFDMLRGRGYEGSVKTVRNYVRTVRPRSTREAFLRLNTLAGEQAQVDWASFGTVMVHGARRPLSCFVMVLSHSRALYARFFLDQTQPSFLRGHVEAFDALGGIAREILYDNLKSVVLERTGDHIRFHPELLSFAGHYHFQPKPCAPYRGNEKGKVERQIQYLRHAFFAARTFADLDDLNTQLVHWIRDVAHARPVPDEAQHRTIATVLELERASLLALPAPPHPCETVRVSCAQKTPYLRFDDNDYSIPATLIGKPLTLVATDREVRVLDGDHCVAQHLRSFARKQRIEDRSHFEALVEQKRHARALRGRDVLRVACPNAEAFLAALASRNQPMGIQTSRLHQLLDRYGAEELNLALSAALVRDAPSAASVAYWLDQQHRTRNLPPPLPPMASHDPRIQDLHVPAHALHPYDTLGAKDGSK